MIPVFKSYAEVAGAEDLSPEKRCALQKMDAGTRASMNGQAPAKVNYGDWLRGQDEEKQKEVLGRTRWDLWKKGSIGMADMVHQSGRPLTIEELRHKIARG